MQLTQLLLELRYSLGERFLCLKLISQVVHIKNMGLFDLSLDMHVEFLELVDIIEAVVIGRVRYKDLLDDLGVPLENDFK